jgi:CheY-like chemotaxis protein
MPGMTGLELLPKAKATRPDVPVIMITASSCRTDARLSRDAGAWLVGLNQGAAAQPRADARAPIA